MAPRSEDLFDEDDVPSINPYEVLGIEKTATAGEVKSAYRKAALKNHPGTWECFCSSSTHLNFTLFS
jgi:DnaJ family protein C protein 9